MTQPKEPVQQRSRKSLEVMLAAVERLMEEREFQDITVQEIAAEAEVSVGLLYTRFGGKDEILPYLVERFMARQRDFLDEVLRVEPGENPDLGERVDRLLEFLTRLSAENRGLVRAAAVRRLLRPSSLTARERALSTEIRKAAYEWLLSGEEQVARASPPEALAFVNSLAFLVVQLTAVIEEDPADLAAVVENLREASLAYLTSSGPVRSGT